MILRQLLPIAVVAGVTAGVAVAENPFDFEHFELPFPWEIKHNPDSIYRLTESDFIQVADELGVEVASIKAVVEIEAGKTHQGFSAPLTPLVNFDLRMFRNFAGRRGVNLGAYARSHPNVFNPSGRTQADVTARLRSAMEIDSVLAVESTFWGMFQIGGFNWRRCGVESVEEFVELMSRSERDQLELFARFITSTGLLEPLRKKNWSAFARGYNGPSYASRGYHTKLANAYRKYKSMETK